MGRRVNTAVWMEKHNRWQIKVQKEGLRKTFYSSTPGRTGQRECNQKADDWLDENLIQPDIKANKLFDAWLGELKETTGRGHWSIYEGFWNNWIKCRIGNVKVNAITEQMIQDVINKAHKAGLAKKTLQNMRACMVAFIKYCRKCRATTMIIENVYIPKSAPVGERTILQPDDLTILLTKDRTVMRGKEVIEPYINAFRFEVTTGMRPGDGQVKHTLKFFESFFRCNRQTVHTIVCLLRFKCLSQKKKRQTLYCSIHLTSALSILYLMKIYRNIYAAGRLAILSQ